MQEAVPLCSQMGLGITFLRSLKFQAPVEQKLGEHPIEEFHVIVRLINGVEILQMQSVGGVLIFVSRTSF